MSHFTRPPIITFETDTAQIAGGGDSPGWVSGTFNGLADGVTADCIFDLGPNWFDYPLLQVTVQPVGATSLSAVQVGCNTSAAVNTGRRIRDCSVTTAWASPFATLTSASGAQSLFCRPQNRYFWIRGTNTAGSGAMGASKAIVSMYPN